MVILVVAGSGSPTVSTINLKTQSGASAAIAVLDGAIEKVLPCARLGCD